MKRVALRLVPLLGLVSALLVLAALGLGHAVTAKVIAYALQQGYSLGGYGPGGYGSGSYSAGDIYLFDLRTLAQINLTRSPQADETHPAWSLDGSQIAYQQIGAARRPLICVLGSRTRCYVSGGDPNSDLRWSPDGRKIAYRDSSGFLDTLDLETGAVRHYGIEDELIYWGWSPDGSHFVAATFKQTSDLNNCCAVYLANSDLSGQHLVYQGSLRITSVPDWSPDGKQLVFMASDGLNPPYIYTLDTDLGRVRILSRFSGSPTWSPAGTQIAFISDQSGDLELYLMNPDGSHARPLTDAGQWRELEYLWSPDGTHILFMGDRSGSGDQLFVLDLDSSQVEQIPAGNGRKTEFAWQP